jgi:hypothetical protein
MPATAKKWALQNIVGKLQLSLISIVEKRNFQASDYKR